MRRSSAQYAFAGCSSANRAVDKCDVADLGADDPAERQGGAYRSFEAVPAGSAEPCACRLCRAVPVLQLLSWVEDKVASGLFMPSLMLEDAMRTLIDDSAKSCAQPLEACTLGDIDDAAAFHC